MQYKIIVDKQPSSNPSDEKKEYIVETEELRIKGSVYDSIDITPDKTYVTRRLSLSEYGVLSVLKSPQEEDLGDINIQLFEGENYIYLYEMQGNKLCAEYIVKNDFTDQFVTKNEMNSSINQSAQSIELNVNQKLKEYATNSQLNNAVIELNSTITQTASSINLQVSQKVGKTEIISSINQSAEAIKINANKINISANDVLNLLANNSINLTSKNITINSNNFNVDKDGNLTCNNATFKNGNLDYYSSTGTHLGTQMVVSDSSSNSEGICLTVYSAEEEHPIYMIESFDFGTIMNITTINDNKLYGVASSKGYSGIIKVNSAIEAHNVFCNYLAKKNSVVDYIYCVNNLYVNGYVRGTNIINSSDESMKENIKKLSTNENKHIDIIKKSDICEFNYKGQKEKTMGLVIGENYNLPDEVVRTQVNENGNKSKGVDLYSMIALAWQAIKEQQNIIEKIEKKVEEII